MNPAYITAGRNIRLLPMDLPLVARYVNRAECNVPTLLDQINQGMYDFAFRGKQNLIFLDLGANIGLVSLHALDVCDRIVAVEPDPDTFAVLDLLTCKHHKIQILPFAVTEKDGEVPFHRNEINTTADSVVNMAGVETIVQSRKLSSILRRTNLTYVDFCKVDIEGSETDALTLNEVQDAKKVIKSYWVETHNCPRNTWEEKLATLVRIFLQTGYHKMRIEGMSLYVERPA